MPEDAKDTTDALVSLGTGPAAKELYVDLLRPAAKELGTSLHTVARAVTLAMAPLRGLVWGFEKVQDWLATALLRRLAGTEPEQIQTPLPYVAGPILLQLPFCAEQEQLREMYANLLASAMRRDVARAVHPAFVHVVQQLTPDEAILLRAAAKPSFDFSFYELHSERTSYKTEGGSISQQFRKACEAAGVVEPLQSDAYLDNLLRLKILTEQQWSEGTYHPAGFARHGDYPASIENSNGRLVEMSTFGLDFVRTCLADLPAEKSAV
jgi:hypothetical protein